MTARRRLSYVPMDRDQYVPADFDLYHNIFFAVKYGLILTAMLAVVFAVGVLIGAWFW